VAHGVCHLVELAVFHFVERVEDAPLHGLQAVLDVGDGPVFYDVGSVFDEVFIEYLVDIGHYSRFSMMNSRRSGVFFPM
jgi:hypothetical protein